MDIYYWGGKRGGKNWRLKIYPPNVAIFGKNLAVFGFWDLVTLVLSCKFFANAVRTFWFFFSLILQNTNYLKINFYLFYVYFKVSTLLITLLNLFSFKYSLSVFINYFYHLIKLLGFRCSGANHNSSFNLLGCYFLTDFYVFIELF